MKYRMWYDIGKCISDTPDCHGKGFLIFEVEGLVIQRIKTQCDKRDFSLCTDCSDWIAQTDIRHLIDTNEINNYATMP